MPYEELSGSPTEGVGEGMGPTAQRMFATPWANRFALAATLTGAGAFPLAYPGLAHCRITSISIKPLSNSLISSGAIGDPTQLPAYLTTGNKPAALLTVTYGPAFDGKAWPSSITKPSLRAGTTLRLRVRGSGQFLTIPGRVAHWEDDPPEPASPSDPEGGGEVQHPVPPDLDGRILIPLTDYNLQWDFVDNPPVDRLRGLVGTVNQDSFLGAPPETLLFDNYDIDDSFRCSITNPHTNRVTVQLRERRITDGTNIHGWNHDFRENPPGWQKILLADDEPRYQPKVFANIFT